MLAREMAEAGQHVSATPPGESDGPVTAASSSSAPSLPVPGPPSSGGVARAPVTSGPTRPKSGGEATHGQQPDLATPVTSGPKCGEEATQGSQLDSGTPVRSPWLISGAHRSDAGEATWLENVGTDMRKRITMLSRRVSNGGVCRSCSGGMRLPVAASVAQCRQM